jgi:hypothetical protein
MEAPPMRVINWFEQCGIISLLEGYITKRFPERTEK